MSWDEIKRDQTFTMPEPNQKPSPPPPPGPVRRPDGRTVRKTGRTKQFNPRVTPEFMERFAEARAEEGTRLGEEITQAHFLELLLATYQRARGQPEIRPFGLSEPAFEAARAIAGHMDWPLSAVIEDAIAARYKQFSIAKPPETKAR